jgi:hypothetical protein
MRRRDALSTLATVTLAGAAGCGTGRDSPRVVALWNGWELTQFRDVLGAGRRRLPFRSERHPARARPHGAGVRAGARAAGELWAQVGDEAGRRRCDAQRALGAEGTASA